MFVQNDGGASPSSSLFDEATVVAVDLARRQWVTDYSAHQSENSCSTIG